jgi:ATP-binding cassette, subfamily B, bacterial MsbA
VRIARFLWRRLRRYTGWMMVAFAAILTFAVATALLASLIEPIFGEVLLTEGGLPFGMGAGTEPAAPPPASADGVDSDVAAADAADAPDSPDSPGGAVAGDGGLPEWLSVIDLQAWFDRGYEGLKSRLGVTPAEVVYFVPLLFVAIFLLRSIADFLSGYAFQRIGLGVTTDIRNELYGRILHQSSRFHADHPSGELVSRVINDVALMQNAVSNRLLDLFQQSITLLFLLGLLLSTHMKLALICLVATPALLVPIVRFGKGMRRTSHRSQERMADLAALMAEGVRGHRVVKAFGMERFEYDRFSEATHRHLKVNLRAQVLSHLSSPVVESLAVIGSAALLVYAGRAIRADELTASVLIGFLAKLLMMYDPVRKLNKVNLILQEALAAAHRVSRLLAIPNEVEDRTGAGALDKVRDGIRFRDVTFSYEEKPVLRGIDLEVASGEIVALVGASGAGKSTLVNLLPRFFDPDEGGVEIDGVDIRDLSLENLRSLIGLVTQDTWLFNDTVRANVAYGRADLPLERVREAAAAAYADEFIMHLPKGYDTVLGEGGLRLSGGQRQRLAIARALLKNAPILILDEATSQLDSESEALVQKALYNLMQGRTTLVIAHRLSTVMKANRILVMDAGRVVEEGSHEELLALGGAYKRLYDLQFRT